MDISKWIAAQLEEEVAKAFGVPPEILATAASKPAALAGELLVGKDV
jgi:hypothetical protein